MEFTKHPELMEAVAKNDCGCLMIGAEKPKSDAQIIKPVFAVADQHF